MADPYFSELKYLGGPDLDFIEIAVDIGADVSDLVVTIYNSNGSIRTTNTLIGLTATTVNGKDVYVIDTTSSGTFNGLGKTNGISLSDGTGVYDFFSFDDLASPITATAGPASGLTSTQIGMAGAGESLETTDSGATYAVQTTPNSGTIPCLTGGTNILTLEGQVPVENLLAGDHILNADGVARPLVWSFNRPVNQPEMRANPKLFPIRICQGALGSGLPQRDLLVSRQHRMMVTSVIAKRMFGTSQVLVAAIKLVGLPGIFVDKSVSQVTYFHLLFAEHEILIAEGAPTESLFLGVETIRCLPQETLDEVEALFPNFRRMHLDLAEPPMIAKGRKEKQLVARHAMHQKPMIVDQLAS